MGISTGVLPFSAERKVDGDALDGLISDFPSPVFGRVPFSLERHGKTFCIGEGEPAFRVTIRGDIPKKEFLSSTTLALGEAYLRGNLTVEGHLFTALCAILPHAGHIDIHQLLMTKGMNNTLPMTRWY